jgi:hypothetical protein
VGKRRCKKLLVFNISEQNNTSSNNIPSVLIFDKSGFDQEYNRYSLMTTIHYLIKKKWSFYVVSNSQYLPYRGQKTRKDKFHQFFWMFFLISNLLKYIGFFLYNCGSSNKQLWCIICWNIIFNDSRNHNLSNWILFFIFFFDCIYIIDLFSMYNGRKRNATRFSFLKIMQIYNFLHFLFYIGRSSPASLVFFQRQQGCLNYRSLPCANSSSSIF